ncbi:MAG: serine O-acetyltransferase [Elusimicrobiaceae bacterium]|nr:serine O-acetyltransferase [Elusimicrobiaceae bacterium]
MFKLIKQEIKTIKGKDPAAKSTLEIILLYQGFHALILHRLAHKLYKLKVPFLPRLISQFSRFITGIEIHPGAQIGKNFFIDHGMGVVIGETSIIGDNCLVYQGVTLGGTGKEKGKRHPTIGNNVTLGAGAILLGNITIGDNSNVGAGSVVIKSAKENSTLVGVPARVVKEKNFVQGKLMHNKIPDPVSVEIELLKKEIEVLKEAISK